jgi:hypothetical protein
MTSCRINALISQGADGCVARDAFSAASRFLPRRERAIDVPVMNELTWQFQMGE